MPNELILNYLILANANEFVLNYIIQKRIDIFPVIQELLGVSFEFNSDKMINIQKLIKGNDNFKILENGNIWFRTLSKNINTSSNYHYEKSITTSFISWEKNTIIERKIIKKYFPTQMPTGVFQGEIHENIYDENLNIISCKMSSWRGNSNFELPTNDLNTSVIYFNELGNPLNTTERTNFSNNNWFFVLNGDEINIQENSIEAPKRSLNKLKHLKNTLLSKIKKEN